MRVSLTPVEGSQARFLCFACLLCMLSMSCAGGETTPTSADGDEWASIDVEATVEVGLAVGPDPYLFSSIPGAFEAEAGELVIADAPTREIRVFDSSGTHLRTIGGKGQGPGEFVSAPAVSLVRPDLILAWDYRGRRLTWFTLRGEIVREATLDHMPGDMLGGSIWGLHPDGVVIGYRARSSSREDGVVHDPISLVITHADSRTVREISNLPSAPNVRVGSATIPGLLHPTVTGNWAVRVYPPAIVAAADPEGRWLLSVYDLDGTLMNSLAIPVPRRELTEDTVQAAQGWWREFIRGRVPEASLRDYRTAIDRMPVPEKLPAISLVLVDESQRVWVKRWAGSWEKEGNDVFDVLDQSGHWLGFVMVDRTLGQILSIGEDHILFHWRDAFDHPRVRRHRLRTLLREPSAPGRDVGGTQ